MCQLSPGGVQHLLVTGRLLRKPALQGSLAHRETIGYLLDVIMTRDPWMHRSDIAAATGRQMTLTGDHDGVIIEDVAREWALRHGRPCTLTLTGPVGREYVFDPAGSRAATASDRDAPGRPDLTVDAVEFCRIVSGRGPGDGLLSTRVPF